MTRRGRLVGGGVVIVGALSWLIYAGVTQSSVYFVTPTEITSAPVTDKAYRLGGLVAPGSLHWDARTLELTFMITDGKASVPVQHKGTPPDMFGEGRGAIVEGHWTSNGHFKSNLILAKHSEEYKAGEYKPPSPSSPSRR